MEQCYDEQVPVLFVSVDSHEEADARMQALRRHDTHSRQQLHTIPLMDSCQEK